MPQDLNQLLQPLPEHIRHMRLGTDEASGLNLRRGDLLIIDTSLAPRFGDVVVASINGRWRPRLLQRMSGRIILTAKTFSTPEAHYQLWAEMDLLGVVTHAVHTMRTKGRRALPQRPPTIPAHDFPRGPVN